METYVKGRSKFDLLSMKMNSKGCKVTSEVRSWKDSVIRLKFAYTIGKRDKE